MLAPVSRPKSQLLKKPNKGKQALESAIKENSVGSVGYQRERFKNRLITCKFEAVRFFTQSIVDNIVDFYALFTSKPVDKVQYRLKNN
ncbi:hypothetical protein I636_19635 [Alteromonas mediterranea UM4b]|nr:hypothetical protein I636_19635 [Alteromonas mediterranea UM4b]